MKRRTGYLLGLMLGGILLFKPVPQEAVMELTTKEVKKMMDCFPLAKYRFQTIFTYKNRNTGENYSHVVLYDNPQTPEYSTDLFAYYHPRTGQLLTALFVKNNEKFILWVAPDQRYPWAVSQVKEIKGSYIELLEYLYSGGKIKDEKK